MTKLTPTLLRELREKAEAAPTKSWGPNDFRIGENVSGMGRIIGYYPEFEYSFEYSNIGQVSADIDYIAAANPTTVLALISALETAVEALREIYNECDCPELCLCSNDMQVRARQALAESARLRGDVLDQKEKPVTGSTQKV